MEENYIDEIQKAASKSLVFTPSPGPSLGVEVELGVVDANTGKLVPRAPEIIADLESLGENFAKPELFQCILEVTTGICKTVDDVRRDLYRNFNKALAIGKNYGVSFVSCGTHPLGKWQEQPITQKDRYKHLVNRMGRPARQMLIMGTHVHVGMGSGEKAIAVMNEISYYLPHLLALAASSPYSGDGEDTNMASWRLKLFEALPTAGLSPHIDNWAEQIRLMRTLITAGAIESIREIWWDVRPHPGFGTIEIRVCDGISTPTEVLVVAALIQSLAVYLGDAYDHGFQLNYARNWSLKENKWRASRYGLDTDESGKSLARIIRNNKGETIGLREDIERIVEKIMPVAERLGAAQYLKGVSGILKRGASYQRQRECFAKTQSFDEVALHLMREFAEDGAGLDAGLPNFWEDSVPAASA
jgi:carboxylate-amine ligase